MRRRAWMLLLMLSLPVFAILLWFEPTYVVRGWWRGEAFYRGRPTSYWSHLLQHEEWTVFPTAEAITRKDGVVDHVQFLRWNRASVPPFYFRLLPRSAQLDWAWPPLFSGDPAARTVLDELVTDPATRDCAEAGLQNIDVKQRLIETARRGGR